MAEIGAFVQHVSTIYLDKKEHLTCDYRPSVLKMLVEARRIELRSILYYPSGSTSLSRYRNSEPVGQRANVEVPSRFDLYRSHTVHVLRCSPLK